jgi:hypothetical protein
VKKRLSILVASAALAGGAAGLGLAATPAAHASTHPWACVANQQLRYGVCVSDPLPYFSQQ